MEREKAKAVLEAVLFSMGESVELERLAEVIEEDKKTTKALLLEMKQAYEEREGGVTLTEFEGSFQMCTKSDMYDYLIKIVGTPRKYVLSDTILETLSPTSSRSPDWRLKRSEG